MDDELDQDQIENSKIFDKNQKSKSFETLENELNDEEKWPKEA